MEFKMGIQFTIFKKQSYTLSYTIINTMHERNGKCSIKLYLLRVTNSQFHKPNLGALFTLLEWTRLVNREAEESAHF